MIAAIFNLETVYALTGLVLFLFAGLTFADRRHPCRYGSGFFWLILGTIFAFGSILPHVVTGLLVLAMVAIDGAGRVKPGVAERAEAPPDTLSGSASDLPPRPPAPWATESSSPSS